MEDKHIESLINNEREWRRHIIKTLDTMQEEHVNFYDQLGSLREKLSALRVWNRIWRVSGGLILGLIIYWVKGKL